MYPILEESTVEERREYIKTRYQCISDCDNCGICQIFHGSDPEVAFDDYIQGRAEYMDVLMRYR